MKRVITFFFKTIFFASIKYTIPPLQIVHKRHLEYNDENPYTSFLDNEMYSHLENKSSFNAYKTAARIHDYRTLGQSLFLKQDHRLFSNQYHQSQLIDKDYFVKFQVFFL